MKRIINDWEPEIKSLLETLTKHGCTLVKGDNGEDEFTFDGDLPKFIENLIACDEAHLYVKDVHGAKTRWLYLVLGNDPGELVADYSLPKDYDFAAEATDPLDKAVQAHSDAWTGRKQPTKEANY